MTFERRPSHRKLPPGMTRRNHLATYLSDAEYEAAAAISDARKLGFAELLRALLREEYERSASAL